MNRLALFFLVCSLLLASLTSADAVPKRAAKKHAPEETQLIPIIPAVVTTYDVYVGGIHLLSADIFFHEENHTYHAELSGRTVGFWAKALPWHTSLDAKGTIKGDTFVPVEYVSDDVWGKKAFVTKLHFSPNGDITPEFVPSKGDPNKNPVAMAERRGARDPITALLQLLAHVAVQGNCNATVPVFEGKRRFDVTGIEVGTDEIDSEGYGVFKGKARACDAEFNLITGAFKEKERSRFWQKNDKGDTGRAPFHVWLARVTPELPELPVRLESDSVFGLIVMHLTGWHYANGAAQATAK